MKPPGNSAMNLSDHFPTHVQTVERGLFGIFATSAGTVVSFVPEIELWLRITSLVVGIVLGLATLYSILSKRRP